MSESVYQLRSQLRPRLWLIIAVLFVLGTAVAVAGDVYGGGLVAIVLGGLVIMAALALLVYALARTLSGTELRLDEGGLKADGQRIAWSDVTRVEGLERTMVIHRKAGPGVAVRAPLAGPREWRRITDDVAQRLDADRGYQQRVCEFEQIPGGGCSDALGCAGSATCQLHALKQTQA